MEIEKGIPIPRVSNWASLANRMEVDDSVYLETQSKASTLATAIRKSGFSACQRREGEGFRVWKGAAKNV